jgi:hypothetical protein
MAMPSAAYMRTEMPRPSGAGSGPSGVRGPEARDRPERTRAHAGEAKAKSLTSWQNATSASTRQVP